MKFIGLSVMFFPFLICGQNINGTASYSKQFIKVDSILGQSDESKRQLSSRILKVNTNIKRLTYKLIFNDSLAKYDLENTMTLDVDNAIDTKLAKVFSGFLAEAAYYDLKKSQILFEKNFLGEKILISSKINSNDWVLTKESQKINNIQCFKATKKIKKAGRNIDTEVLVIAWYSPSININYGPDGFAGLPGLIVKLQVDNVVTYLTELDLNRNQKKQAKVSLPDLDTTKVLSEEEYHSLLKDFNENRGKYIDKN
ncbi:GLPGLI family protein [Winogradskyella sp.]|uniref:GLPGLI family protein n=1 Tax=Winogradskyella sp. TaxID=1883156 RepID=UPI002618EEA4|nr:GLPGLI family protein [Winogradskyella sp.]